MVTLPCRRFLSASGLSVSSRVFPALLQSSSQFWGPPYPLYYCSPLHSSGDSHPLYYCSSFHSFGVPHPLYYCSPFQSSGVPPPLKSFSGSHFDARFLFSSSDLRVLDPFELILYGVRESDLVAFFDTWVSSFSDSICWRSSFPVCVFDTSVKEDVTVAVAVWAPS